MRILGIDPGSRLVGFGCVDRLGNQVKHVAHGTLRVVRRSGGSEPSFADRLLEIHRQLTEIILKFKPQVMAVEEVFFAKNAVSALKLGQARGAVLLTGRIHGLELVEYAPTAVKRAVVGHGQADKEQVAKMVRLILGNQITGHSGQPVFETADASDALALAICHAQMVRLSAVPGLRSPASPKGKKDIEL